MNLRWFHKFYAKTFGYFWLPCPICGEYFGGHEILDKKTAHILVDGTIWSVCTKDACISEAISHNISKWYATKK